MKGFTRVLLVGGASYDIQRTANQIARRSLFPQPFSFEDVNIINISESKQMVVAPGFVDFRRHYNPKNIKAKIKSTLRSLTPCEYYAVVVVLR